MICKFQIVRLLVILTSVGCSNTNLDHLKPYYVNNDSIVKDFPIRRDGGLDVFYASAGVMASSLNLPNLEHGFDSIQVRFWYPEWTVSRVLILAKYNGQWEGTLCKFRPPGAFVKENELSDITFHKISPKSGWQKVEKKLFNLGITDIKDSHSLPDYPGAGTDGDAYSIEYATVDKYRFYTYVDPFAYPNLPECNRMAKIIELINLEFPSILK